MVFLRTTKKIPCYVLVFDQTEIIRQSLNFIANYADRLELVIIENPSDNSPKIQKIINDLGRRGLIKRYYRFKENITGNAYETVLNRESEKIKKSRFVLISDGDLVSDDRGWLDEEINILNKHSDVFACGVSLDMSNLPLSSFPDAKTWIPADKAEHADFFEAYTGGHFLMLRGREFYEFMKWKNANNRKFVDGEMHGYCYDLLSKKWARTKKSKAYHLTWDLYKNKKNPYTKMKTGKSFRDTWYHNREASYELTEY